MKKIYIVEVIKNFVYYPDEYSWKYGLSKYTPFNEYLVYYHCWYKGTILLGVYDYEDDKYTWKRFDNGEEDWLPIDDNGKFPHFVKILKEEKIYD